MSPNYNSFFLTIASWNLSLFGVFLGILQIYQIFNLVNRFKWQDRRLQVSLSSFEHS